MFNLPYINALISQYNSATIDRSLSPNETMNNQWYFDIGKYAIDSVLMACFASGATKVSSVLDLPCGHGRVLRHLVAMFQGARFHACDLDHDGVDFCVRTFGARPVISQPDLTKVDFGTTFDLIWVGSLFTHTSRELTRQWMTHLASFLSPSGIIVATMHGRWSEHVYLQHQYITEDKWKRILQGYRETGYGYADYSTEENHSYITGSYGVSLAKPHAILQDIETIPDVRIYSYHERGWGEHQDVVVFGRPSYAMPW